MSSMKKSKKVFSRIMDIILGVILGLILLLTAVTLIQKYTDKSIIGYRVLWVQTPSMEETIPSESYILVKDTKSVDIGVGDIIVYISDDPSVPEGATVTHRIVGINDDGTFKTKGDNNPIEDVYTVNPENVLYEHVKNLPILSLFGKLYTTPYGYGVSMGVIIIVFGIIIFMEKKNSDNLSENEVDRLVAEEVKRLEEEAKQNNIL